MKKLAIILLSLPFVMGSSHFVSDRVSTPEDPILSSYFAVPKDKATLDRLADQFEVEHRHGDGFEFIVPFHRKGEFLALAPHAKLLEADISAAVRDAESRWDRAAGYHTFQTVEDHLRRIVTNHPDLAKLEVYGKSKEGRSLFALKLASRVQENDSRPELLLTSATHGDEIITTEVLFGIIDSLVENYRTNARAKQILDTHQVYFVPVVNPDGYVRRSRYANGVDPNRDYPWPEMPERNPNECIRGIMDFFAKHEFKGSIDFHAAAGVVMYPWSYKFEAPESKDEQKFVDLTKMMANLSGYRYGQIPNIMYIAKGASADYYYWKNRSMAIAVEISDSKAPSPGSFPKYIRENLESTYAFIEAF